MGTSRSATRSAAVIVVALTAAAVSAVSPAVAAAAAAPADAVAGWTSPKAVQPGVRPVLSFSPTGHVALGTELIRHGRLIGSEIDLADGDGVFASHRFTLSLSSAGQGAEPLQGLALSSSGSLAASFADASGPSAISVRVAASGSHSFTRPETLVPRGSASSGQASPDSLVLLPTADAEIVGAGTDDAGRLVTATLAGTQTRFATAPGPSGLSATDAVALAADPAGSTYLAGDGANGCTMVAFRPAHQRFRSTYRTGNCSSATPNVFDAIAVTGGGHAGLLSEDVSESGADASRLLIQVGTRGHFGHATELGGALGGPVGLAADADGELTAEWTGCVSGPLVNGQLTTTGCAIDAATGSASGGFSPAAASGTSLMRASAGVTLSAATADRGVIVSRCAAGACGLYAFTARPGGGFRVAVRLATAKRLIAVTGDTHGDLLAVWLDPRGHVYAVTGSASTGRWSQDHRLSTTGVAAADVSAAYGPRHRAIVAWSVGNETDAASYVTSGP